MKHSSRLVIEAPVEGVVDALSDLATYPAWNELVSNAEPAVEAPDDPGPAWLTTLTAKVGPFARSKQLRFVRDTLAVNDERHETRIQFSRVEHDGRDHASWTMKATVIEDYAGGAVQVHATKVTLELEYDGGLWVPSLGPVLDKAIERATRKLPAYVKEQSR